jgi:hypothetical protein
MARRAVARGFGLALNITGVLLLAVGAVVGWVAPRVALPGAPAALSQHIAASAIDVSSYLGADITALAVIIAVVIGFNVTILQIAGQAHSLSLIRGILATLLPFLLCWCVTTGVALIYFLIPIVYVGQLWQLLAWFGAVVLLMIAYLWDLPWRLSGDYVARWALGGLRGVPVARWETLEGYSVLQTAVAGAAGRGDLGTLRALTLRLGRFLITARDPKAEAANAYDRGRYRALKGILSGCSQSAGQGPTAIAYFLGYVQAGVLLQAVADGHPMDDADHDLFSGVLRAVRDNPDHITRLWTGLRHALCRPADHQAPYLLAYWQGHDGWPVDDPRRVTSIAVALARFHAACAAELRREFASGGEGGAGDAGQVAELAKDLYRDLAEHLGPAIAQAQRRQGARTRVRLTDLPLTLLDDIQAQVMRTWGADTPAGSARVEVVNAYESQRALLNSGSR